MVALFKYLNQPVWYNSAFRLKNNPFNWVLEARDNGCCMDPSSCSDSTGFASRYIYRIGGDPAGH